MQHTLLMVPIGLGVGLSTVSRGLERALENQGLKVSFLDPISHFPIEEEIDDDQALANARTSLPIQCVESLLSKGEEDRVLEFLITYFEHFAKDADVVVIQGIISTQLRGYASKLNFDISQGLDAEVIFVLAPIQSPHQSISKQIEIAAQPYGGVSHPKVLGCMLNKVGAPVDKYGNARIDLFDPIEKIKDISESFAKGAVFKKNHFQLLGCFPWERRFMAFRVKDIQKFLGAEVIEKGKMDEQRVMHLALAAATVENMAKVLKPETMIITSGDRSDVIVATCLAYVNGTNIAALLLTGGYLPEFNTKELCQTAIEMGLPILSLQTDSLRTSIALQSLNMEIPEDDWERQEAVMESMAHLIDKGWIEKLSAIHPEKTPFPTRLSASIDRKGQESTSENHLAGRGRPPHFESCSTLCEVENS